MSQRTVLSAFRCTSSCRRASHSAPFRRFHYASPSFSALEQPNLKNARNDTSELGLRSRLPPDSNSRPDPKDPPKISDQDWEIRTGRAIYVLQNTIPNFFHTGLTTSIDKATGTPRPTQSIPVINANPLDYQTFQEDVESIYSPKIRLSYTPPGLLPPPFPKTLHVEGLPLYMASSAFVRHTLNALYSDLNVVLRKVIVKTPSSYLSTQASTASEQSEPQKRRPGKKSTREKSLLVGLCVTGTSRVSGSLGEWEVNSTYTFSPITGLIQEHVINSIYPAPHQAVYDSLRSSLGKIFGLGWEGSGGATRANETVCKSSNSIVSRETEEK